MLRAFALTASLLIPGAALAQSLNPNPDVAFTLRGGGSVTPGYFGSTDYKLGPDVGFSLQYLRLGRLEFGSSDPLDPRLGFGLRGSFRYIGERNAADYPELTGLNTVKQSVELGLGVGFKSEYLEAFADARYGVVGHNAWVGEAGVDAVYRPTPRLKLRAGPRIFLGDDKYSNTYFGVTAAESGASGLSAYNASGGMLSAGVEIGATYAINDAWGIDGAVSWNRLTGDAAGSPIVTQGSRDQYKLRIGLTRRFGFNF